jgi:CYTH domain-containing protein
MEAARIAVVLATKTSSQGAAAAWDSATLRVKDVEDRATLAEREVLERVSRVEAENTMALASARLDVKGFIWKIALLEGELAAECQAQEVSKRERREQFEELNLLQTRGSELWHAIIGLPRERHHLSEGMRHMALCQIEMAGELAAL